MKNLKAGKAAGLDGTETDYMKKVYINRSWLIAMVFDKADQNIVGDEMENFF